MSEDIKLDELRQQAGETPFEETPEEKEPPRPIGKQFLGMTPQQRFVIAALLLMMSCILSVCCLLATGKIVF